MFTVLSQGVAPAVAADVVADPTAQGGFASFLPFILVLVIFYFMLIRPQQRRVKQHQDMVGGLKKGDRIITGGGIVGTISKLESDDMIQVQIAEGVMVTVARTTILGLLPVTSSDASTGKVKKSKQVANDN